MIKNLKMIQFFLRGRKNEKVLCQNDVLFKAQSYFQEANGLVASGHLKESIAYFEKAIAHIDSATYHHYKGNAHDRLGEFAEAENEWTESISKNDPIFLRQLVILL